MLRVVKCAYSECSRCVVVDRLNFDIMTDFTSSACFNTIGSEVYCNTIRVIKKSNVRLSVLVQALELAIRRI